MFQNQLSFDNLDSMTMLVKICNFDMCDDILKAFPEDGSAESLIDVMGLVSALLHENRETASFFGHASPNYSQVKQYATRLISIQGHLPESDFKEMKSILRYLFERAVDKQAELA